MLGLSYFLKQINAANLDFRIHLLHEANKNNG
jgi:hypothetical protein